MVGQNIIRDTLASRPLVPCANEWYLSVKFDGNAGSFECGCQVRDGFLFATLVYKSDLSLDVWTDFVDSACERAFVEADYSVYHVEVGSKKCEASIVFHI